MKTLKFKENVWHWKTVAKYRKTFPNDIIIERHSSKCPENNKHIEISIKELKEICKWAKEK